MTIAAARASIKSSLDGISGLIAHDHVPDLISEFPAVVMRVDKVNYTDLTYTAANTAILAKFSGTLDANGRATASFNVPSGLPPLVGLTLHHAFVAYKTTGPVMASNAVPLDLKN